MLDQTSQQPLSIIFTLRTYTHATRQNQDEAAQTMGEISWASHVSRKRTQKYRREGKTSSPVLFKPIRTFPRVGHGVGQCLTHILTHTVFSVFATKKASKTEVFDAFWSCWADSNCRPHPYQIFIVCFFLLYPFVSYSPKALVSLVFIGFPVVSCCLLSRLICCGFLMTVVVLLRFLLNRLF